ncbi:MAG: BlaI/MecI/CopY family transcriptional regulator [Lawsonibacter sp.]|nr:BlaI/MecI/CopY family transcriptional regulator [Lawsonibacter sp.]
MGVKLFDSERKVMEVLWQQGDIPAREIAQQLARTVGWNKNTTYTVLKKCVEKGAVERQEPNFLCRARVGREEVRRQEAAELVEKMFDGSASLLFASLLSGPALPEEEIARLKALVDQLR